MTRAITRRPSPQRANQIQAWNPALPNRSAAEKTAWSLVTRMLARNAITDGASTCTATTPRWIGLHGVAIDTIGNTPWFGREAVRYGPSCGLLTANV
jgi:hypothetical protein